MDTTPLSVWHALLQSSPKQNALLGVLSPELSEKLKNTPPISADPYQGCGPLEEELPHVHFSWLTPFLRSLSETDIKLFLSSLSLEQVKGLKNALLLSNTMPTPTTLGKTYLRRTLFEQIATDSLAPFSCLPEHPLNCLLDLSTIEFTSLVELLSMHDLSVEIRQIIETSRLKEINALLSKAQTAFLKTLLHKKEPVTFKKMGLQAWKGNPDELRSMLLQRGINRIAKSLYGADPSLLWYVAHRLNSEKGQLLMQLCTPLDHPRASSLIRDQIVELAHAIKNNNPPENL